jgi:predicted AAA+ superfamily ATPase
MGLYSRYLESQVQKYFFKGKVLVLVGARQVGKTTLMKMMLEKYKNVPVLRIDGENPADRELLEDRSLEYLKQVVGESKILIVDESQKIGRIGQSLKLLVDFYGKDLQIVASGSSSVNLLDQTKEPLTGRKYVFEVFPLSFGELSEKDGNYWRKELNSLFIYGSYPGVVTSETLQEKRKLLLEISGSYLYKDILEYQDVRNPEMLRKLLKALALQVGSEVSYNELASLLGIDRGTVERYVDLLEKSYVIFRLSPLTKNKRREIGKSRKIYFCDLGIRNALLNNFSEVDVRTDIGALWENLMIIERMKYRASQEKYVNQYFWRTYDGKEIDLVEEEGGKLRGFEFKWGNKAKVKQEGGFEKVVMVNRENYGDFVGSPNYRLWDGGRFRKIGGK